MKSAGLHKTGMSRELHTVACQPGIRFHRLCKAGIQIPYPHRPQSVCKRRIQKTGKPTFCRTDPDSCALHRTNRKPPDRQKDWRRHNRHPIAAAQDEIRISPRCLRNPPLELRFSQHIVFEGDCRSLHITGIARIAAASAVGAVLIYGSVAMFCFSLYMLPPSPIF